MRGGRSPESWAFRLALGVRSLVTLLLPRGFRERYGEEMRDAFRTRLMDSIGFGGRGPAGLFSALLREMVDLAKAAVRLRREERRRRARPRGRVWWWELRMATRWFRRRPGSALVGVGTLAVAIGAATAMFALVHSVLLAPLSYPEADRLVQVFQTNPELGWERGPVSLRTTKTGGPRLRSSRIWRPSKWASVSR